MVHGRFHAFDLVHGLIGRGHDVTLFTNYPSTIVRRFNIAPSSVRSFVSHGVAVRVVPLVLPDGVANRFDSMMHTSFGAWARRRLIREGPWDVIYSWSSVSEEILRSPKLDSAVRLVVRGSAHIVAQADLLRAEEARTGIVQEQPKDWTTRRELREYELADGVVVLSTFCRDTFLNQGFPAERLHLLVSGTRTERFRSPPEVIAERKRRIRSGEPLRVLNVGTFSYRKGAWDFAKVAAAFDPAEVSFRFVGTVHGEAKELADSLKDRVRFVPRRDQWDLPEEYAWADLFYFPTIEDGFPAVLAQAAASGLPILTTPNGAGTDLVDDGEQGWIIPIRSPEAATERLRWCLSNRALLGDMVDRSMDRFRGRDWNVVSADFEKISRTLLKAKKPGRFLNIRRGGGKGRRRLDLSIVVHGRFYAFDLARELIRLGTNVRLYTNYPRWVVAKFGVAEESVVSFVSHGMLSRLFHRIDPLKRSEPLVHRMFSTWAARRLRDSNVTHLQAFSGVAEEVFHTFQPTSVCKILVRGSTHIESQYSLLVDEQARCGREIDIPSTWMRAREQREYDQADRVVVLSDFARQSFIRRGFSPDKVTALPLGSDLDRFRPDPAVVDARAARIESGSRLRVLTVGGFSFRKGAMDLVEMARRAPSSFDFRFVGEVSRETVPLHRRAAHWIDFVRRQPEHRLPEHYEWADVFVFPTIEDGFAVVLAQAQAAGLPILATPNCAAPELITEGRTGWILPIRSADAFLERLKWCDANRGKLAAMTRSVYSRFKPRDWEHVAREFQSFVSGIRY